MHNCFSCGFRGGLLYLVAFQRDLFDDLGTPDWKTASQWLSSVHTVDVEALISRLDAARTHAMPFKPVEMSEARLAVFDDPPVSALRERSLSLDAAQRFGVRWDSVKEAWITPIRDAVSAKLMGWQEKGQRNRHFRNYPAGIPKSRTLFGLDVWSGPTMIVVESPLDVVRLESLGLEGGVSTFGAAVSSAQVALMLSAETLIIAFDNDPAGRKASEFMLGQSRSLAFECRFLNYSNTSAKDIGDMTERDVFESIHSSRHCVLGKAALV
jgi:hypothetical protein